MLNKSAEQAETPPQRDAEPITIASTTANLNDIEFSDEDMVMSPVPETAPPDSDDEDESVAGSQPFKAIMADQQLTLAEAKQATAVASKAPAPSAKTTNASIRATKRTATPTDEATSAKRSTTVSVDEPLPVAKLQPLALNMPMRPSFLREVLSHDPKSLMKDFDLPPLLKSYVSLEQYQATMGPRIVAEALASLEDDVPARNRMTVQSYTSGKPLATVVYRVASQLALPLTEGDVVKLEASDRTTHTTVACLGMVQAVDMTEKEGQASVSIMVYGPASSPAHRQLQGTVNFRSLNSLVTSIRQYEGLMSLDTATKALPYILRFTPTVTNGVFNRRAISNRYKSSIAQGLARVEASLNSEQSEAIRYAPL